MFLRMKTRKKDGKTHRTWSVVENRRVAGGRVVQRQVLYLGEINDAQRAGWVRAIEAFEGDGNTARQLALFPSDRERLPPLPCEAVRIRLDKIRLCNPRQWGGCWMALWLWDYLCLDEFWSRRLDTTRKGVHWLNVLKALTCYRLLDPGSEFRFHRQWYDRSALGDLLGESPVIAGKNTLYRCLDRLLEHRDDLFSFLRQRWEDLFNARFDVLLYDLTSTYFQCDPPGRESKKRFGYSRDHRPDCVQVVIALVVTPDGFPLAYEVYPGNTTDKNTLREFLRKIETRYGKIRRTWLMDRGIPTEETLKEMRDTNVAYLVGTPKGRLSTLEKKLVELPWEQARQDVRVKTLEHEGDLYVYVESANRIAKERAMRRRKLKKLWNRLKELREMTQSRDDLLLRLGAAKKEAGRAWGLVTIRLPDNDQEVNGETFRFSLDKKRLRTTIGREGRYLLRSNLTGESASGLWEKYLTLIQVEQAFKELKTDLSIRPVHHSKDLRVEAHIFICFLAYCLQVTLKNLARGYAPGLTPRAILEKLQGIQMIDLYLPTTDNRTVLLTRYTEPDRDTQLLLDTLKLPLPKQPPPKILANGNIAM